MQFPMRLLAIALLLACSCTPATTAPQLGPRATPLAYPPAFAEGDITYDGVLGLLPAPTAHFSVTPEELAALLIETARQQGWGVEPSARPGLERRRWTITLSAPGGQTPRTVYIHEHDGRSALWVGEREPWLPRALYPALRANVQAYLTGALSHR